MKILCIVLLSSLLGSGMNAQVSRTSINGTVVDEQGKRIPAASVQVTNLATGLQRQTQTGAQGTYVLADLENGAFRFEMIMPEEVYSAGAVRLQGQVCVCVV